jgi:X-X-X-Leu-X-X-Gly heptad repeat protein
MAETPQGTAVDAAAAEASAQAAREAAALAIADAAHIAAEAERSAAEETARIAAAAGNAINEQNQRVETLWQTVTEQGNSLKQMAEELPTLRAANSQLQEGLSNLSSGMQTLIERLNPTPKESADPADREKTELPVPDQAALSKRKRRLI